MKSYLEQLKIAVINNDIKKLAQIVNMSPEFENIEEAKEIQAFLRQAIELLQNEKSRLSREMQKIKNLQKFNNKQSTETFDFKA